MPAEVQAAKATPTADAAAAATTTMETFLADLANLLIGLLLWGCWCDRLLSIDSAPGLKFRSGQCQDGIKMGDGTTGQPPGRARRVLVVEDAVEIQELVTVLLRSEGFDVRTSSDGESAIEVARAYEPDLVVLDVNLPGMDGVQVCQRLRAFSEAYVLK